MKNNNNQYGLTNTSAGVWKKLQSKKVKDGGVKILYDDKTLKMLRLILNSKSNIANTTIMKSLLKKYADRNLPNGIKALLMEDDIDIDRLRMAITKM
jgi:hypothetical protein